MNEIRIIIISNPMACPFRAPITGVCTIEDTNWDEIAPDCNKLIFPSFCKLKKINAIFSQEDDNP
jgi:hypothetical protein